MTAEKSGQTGGGARDWRGSAARDEGPSLSAHPPGHSTPCSRGRHTDREGGESGSGGDGDTPRLSPDPGDVERDWCRDERSLIKA